MPNFEKVQEILRYCLPVNRDGSPDPKREKADLVHDFLAFLAEEITRMNREKQEASEKFLDWLSAEIIRGPISKLKGKTKLLDFHQFSLEELLDLLKVNSAIPKPCPASLRAPIKREFEAAVHAIAAHSEKVSATEALIDWVVYRLYGLTQGEVRIVESKS